MERKEYNIVIVGDKKIPTVDVTYNDLITLYKQFIKKYGIVPTYKECDLKHNMPQGRIINRVLKENGVTYNDFLLQFGKVSHVRTESKDYDLFVKKYKEVSNSLGHALKEVELINNIYGLPSEKWLVENCPDKNVKTYDDFVKWCGFKSNKLEKNKEEVIETLIRLEKELDRPIVKSDISLNKTGFSMIVIERLFGGLTKAKEEIGLMKTIRNQPRPFKYYKGLIDEALNNFKKETDRNFISWYDFESGLYSKEKIEHKTILKSFKREDIDFFAYLKSKGFEMNPSNFSHTYTFDDGERVVSTMEYDFSSYLRELGYKYNDTYFRNILYKTFTDGIGKINCDYCIPINGMNLYIEIAGFIYNTDDIDWKTYNYTAAKEREYRDKILKKEQLLINANCDYIFLFKNDMKTDRYKDILTNKINELLNRAV